MPHELYDWVKNNILLFPQKKSQISIAIITALWSASKGLQAITDGLNAAMEVENKNGFLRKRLQACLNLLFITSGIVITLSLIVFSQNFFKLVLPNFEVVHVLFSGLRSISILLLAVLFTCFYRFLPGVQLPFRACARGGFLVSIGWTLFSYLYSYYVNYVSRMEPQFGIAGLSILFMLWFHVCISFLFYGAVLAEQLSKGTYHPLSYIKEAFQI